MLIGSITGQKKKSKQLNCERNNKELKNFHQKQSPKSAKNA